MPASRRHLLRLAVVLPVGLALSRVATLEARVSGSVARGIRPAPSGTSATRCAACGSPGHTMLDTRCPAHPRVR
jgi:hypothetical protein